MAETYHFKLKEIPPKPGFYVPPPVESLENMSEEQKLLREMADNMRKTAEVLWLQTHYGPNQKYWPFIPEKTNAESTI